MMFHKHDSRGAAYRLGCEAIRRTRLQAWRRTRAGTGPSHNGCCDQHAVVTHPNHSALPFASCAASIACVAATIAAGPSFG